MDFIAATSTSADEERIPCELQLQAVLSEIERIRDFAEQKLERETYYQEDVKFAHLDYVRKELNSILRNLR